MRTIITDLEVLYNNGIMIQNTTFVYQITKLC